MSTWLDWYLLGSRRMLDSVGVEARDDREATWLMSIHQAQKGPSTPGGSGTADATFFSCLAGFLTPDERRAEILAESPDASRMFAPPKGFRVSSRLVDGFLGGKAPETDDVWKILDRHSCYFDFPGRSLPITDQTYVRAVFSQPSTEDHNPAVCAVVTSGHSNEMLGRYGWMLRVEGEFSDSVADAPSEAVRACVDRVVRLSCLFFLEREADVPHLARRQLNPNRPLKKEKAAAKKRTIFSIHDLSPHASDTWAGTGKGTGQPLSHRVEVSGHFRWQPYGKGRARKKLIFIDPYVRGKGDYRIPLQSG